MSAEEWFESVRRNPENFVWSDPHIVTLKKSDEDNLGVKVKTIQGRLNQEETFTLVTQIKVKCSEQRRDKLNSGYRVIGGNNVNITKMNQDEVLNALTNYRDGQMQLLVSYPLRLKDVVDESIDKISPREDGSISHQLDNQVTSLVKANLSRCQSGGSDQSVSLKSLSDGAASQQEQQKRENTSEVATGMNSIKISQNSETQRLMNLHETRAGKAAEQNRRRETSKINHIYQQLMNSEEGGERSPRENPISQIATGSPSHRSTHSLPTGRTSQSSPSRKASSPRSPMQKSHSLSNPNELYDVTLEEPHLIVWSTPSKAIEIGKDSDGKLGFRYKEVQNKEDRREIFTLIKEVFSNSPALGKLQRGDRILSVNGQHLQDTKKGINTASIVNRSLGDTVRLIIQRPIGIRERKPLNTTDIKLDMTDRTPALTSPSNSDSASKGATGFPRSPGKTQNLGRTEGKKRPHSGSSGASQPYTSKPIHEASGIQSEQTENQNRMPLHRPNFLACNQTYNSLPTVPQNGLHSTYHMSEDMDKMRSSSAVDPVLVSVNTDQLNITIRSKNNTNVVRPPCSVKVNIDKSPTHAPQKDNGIFVMESLPMLLTPTPSGNGCTCLASWNVKDAFRKVIPKHKNFNHHRSHGDENCNNVNSAEDAATDNYNDDARKPVPENCTSSDKCTCHEDTRINQDTHISRVPCGLLLVICQHLNIKVLTGRDWRGLADEMGKTVHDIQILEQLDDPCRELLQEWGMGVNATLGRLIAILLNPRLDRQDVVRNIKEYLSTYDR